jgi:hypothetical protein
MAGAVTSYFLRLAEPLLEWLLPFLYRPKFVASAWEVGFAVDDVPRDIDLNVMTPDEIADLIVSKSLSGQFSYYFEANLYSYTGTGLRSPVVVFISEGGQEDVHTPIERNPKRPLRVLNLPSRQWVHQEIRGSFPIHGAAAERLAVCKRAKFRAYLPSRRPFETTIVEEPLKSTIP